MIRAILIGFLLSATAWAQLIPSVTAECATSVDGSVVGVPNPLNPPVVAAQYTGTLTAGNYFVQEAWLDAAGHTTLVDPEVQVQLTATGEIQENPPTSGSTVITMGGGTTALTGWHCTASDVTHPTDIIIGTSASTTTATLTVASAISASDVIEFSCDGF